MHSFETVAGRATVCVIAGASPGSRFVGTAFFIAPGVLLTSAHVARSALRDASAGLVGVRGDHVQDGAVLPARLLRSLAAEEDRPVSLGRDLALPELVGDPVDHECVWLAGRHTARAPACGYRAWSTEPSGAPPRPRGVLDCCRGRSAAPAGALSHVAAGACSRFSVNVVCR
ncbi:hypothetical protein [Streptomyces venezuelae]|uniref:hypothetical protein n=1 Tax=Streptomyces venezuelae TaxID=54571 RepID=UPI00123A83CA|nr:hypothetical protein [Streptomyces venezuelae]